LILLGNADWPHSIKCSALLFITLYRAPHELLSLGTECSVSALRILVAPVSNTYVLFPHYFFLFFLISGFLLLSICLSFHSFCVLAALFHLTSVLLFDSVITVIIIIIIIIIINLFQSVEQLAL
jgi:hypothetical protein